MASISIREAAEELLALCLRGERWPRELLARVADSPELFRVVAEGLADRFEPRLCGTYAELFAEAFAIEGTLERYRRVRKARTFQGAAPRSVYVLSRVTLGADVAITSVMLDAAKKRFPDARIFFAGARKNWELFAGDPRIEHLPVAYPRGGTLRERLSAWRELSFPDGMVIDPDSRLTQLGLLPVCAEDDYYFFESRAYGGDGDESLGTLARRWARETFGVDARAYIAPPAGPDAEITVSLGVGENPAKRIGDSFERSLMQALAGSSVMIDKGAGGEESERVERAIAGLPNVRCWDGAFAPFAAAIAKSRLYVGYDSAGQHVAAACGIPLVSVFAGFPAPRMFSRWRPSGPGTIEVVRVEEHSDPEETLERTLRAIGKYGIIQS